ncbi:MAG TPA: CDP-alcohol phosphatidyltransferase family protein [Phycisphaerales bacterium]|nr:CDP-alcohol phosphatidyltransferase family protein [Phycisphaerales bacterium]
MSAPTTTTMPTGAAVNARPGFRAWLPNALTGLRLLIAVAFFILLAVWTYPTRELVVTPVHPVWPYLVCAALFGLAALTDAIDGPLARRWRTVSRFGRVMDPFADKVLVMGAFIMLAGPNFSYDVDGPKNLQVSGILPWMVVVMLSRELLVTTVRSILESEGKDFSATASGKAKMIVQALAVPAILVLLGIAPVQHGTWGRATIDAIAWTTVIVTLISGVPYAVRAVRAI